MEARYLNGQYGFPEGFDHIAGPSNAEAAIRRMAEKLRGTDGLVAIYIPESAEGLFATREQRGRVVGAVRLVEMPAGATPRDYSYPPGDAKPRWPVGWPCEVVYAPKPSRCPLLRDLVDLSRIPADFRTVAGMLRHGPFELPRKLAAVVTCAVVDAAQHV